MNDNLEKIILDLKTPGLSNPETHVLTHNRFNTYIVLIFADLNKAQIYKMSIEIVHIMKLRYL